MSATASLQAFGEGFKAGIEAAASLCDARDEELGNTRCVEDMIVKAEMAAMATRIRAVTERPKALDLFCGAGGASMGLHRAGFDVIGVDIEPQPRYPFKFVQADAMTFPLDGYALIWASPPCQKYCALNTREDLSSYPDLVDPIRQRLAGTKSLTVIENVPGAPLRADITLCGAMFGLRAYRHRLFECSFPVRPIEHPEHKIRVNRRGENRRKHWAAGGFITITGDIGTYVGPEAMGIDWMNGNELSEAIPPAYAEYIGREALSRWPSLRPAPVEAQMFLNQIQCAPMPIGGAV